jgi:two-component system, sensor histidine kinase
MADNYFKLFDENWDFLISLLDNSQDAFWIVNADYSVQHYVNPAFEAIWGYDSGALYENPLFWLDTLVAEDRIRLAKAGCLPHATVANPYQETYRIIRKDGEIRWIQDYTYPIYNRKRLCVGYSGIARDITHKLVQNDDQIANQFLPKLAEKMAHSAFWVIDPTQKKQLYISKGFEKIWGRPVSFLNDGDPNARWLETLVPEDRRPDTGSLVFITSEAEVANSFYRIKRPEGEIRYIHDISFPIYHDVTGALIGYAGIAEDITDEKLYEVELQRAKESAEAANIVKSNFIASISHDLRTPLNGLLGMGEILRSGRCYPEQKEYIDAILQAGNSLLDLIEDIIDFVALDLNKLPLRLQEFNLKKLIEEIILTISPQANEKKIAIMLNYSEKAPKKIYADMSRIRRILTNLINNAVKFTNEGHVLIAVAMLKQSAGKKWLRLMVEDTGIGISPENFEFIFGSFNRVDPSYRGRYKGAGLGLTIVRQFIEDMGGKITVNSEYQKGSIFHCDIPFTRVEKTAVTPASEPCVQEKQTKIQGQTVLLIEDDIISQRITKRMLEEFHCKVTIAKTGQQALEKLDYPYDLIITDIGLPDMDGIQLVEIIRELPDYQKTPIAALTAHVLKKDRDKCLIAGMNHFLKKPLFKKDLRELLTSIFN